MKVEEQLALILSNLDDKSKGISESNWRLFEVQDSVADLMKAKGDFDHWRPQVDKEVTDLRHSVDSLCQQPETLQSPSAADLPLAETDTSTTIKTPAPAYQGAFASGAASGQICHGIDNHHRSVVVGVVTTLVQLSSWLLHDLAHR